MSHAAPPASADRREAPREAGQLGAARAYAGATGVGLLVLAIAGVRLWREVTGGAPGLAKTLLDQLDVATGGPGADGAPALLGPLTVVSPLTGALVHVYGALARFVAADVAVAILRLLQIGSYEAGAVLLCRYALRRGLRPGVAVGLAALYAIQPFAVAKLGWDVLFPAAPLVIAGVDAWGRGHARRSWVAFVAAAGCYPAAGVAASAWLALRARAAAPSSPARSAALRGAAIVFGATCAFVGALLVAGSGGGPLAPMLHQVTSQKAAVDATRGHPIGMMFAQNAAGIALLVGTAGFFIVRWPALLVPLLFDFAYELVTPLGIYGHGLVTATVGMLFALTVDALGPGTPPLSPRRVAAGLLAGGVLALSSSMMLARGLLNEALAEQPPPPTRAEVLAVPEIRGARCFGPPALVPALRDVCAVALPYAWHDRVYLELDPRVVVLVAPERTRWARGTRDSRDAILAAEGSTRAALRAIAAAAGTGTLRVASVSPSLIVLVARGGERAGPELTADLEELARNRPPDLGSSPREPARTR
jgi:hypothetical protein